MRDAVVEIADGPRYQALRDELRVKLSEASSHADIDCGKLCKFEHGLAYLTAAQRQRLDAFLRAEAVRHHKLLSRLVQTWPSSQSTGRASVTA